MSRISKIAIGIWIFVGILIAIVSLSPTQEEDEFAKQARKGYLPYKEWSGEIVWLNYTDYLRKNVVRLSDFDDIVIEDKHVNVTDYVDRKNAARLSVIFSGNLQQILEGYDDFSSEEITNIVLSDIDDEARTSREVFITAFEDMNMTSAEITFVLADIEYVNSKGEPVGEAECKYSKLVLKQRYCKEIYLGYLSEWYDNKYIEKCDIYITVNREWDNFWQGYDIPSCEQKKPFNLKPYLSVSGSSKELETMKYYDKLDGFAGVWVAGQYLPEYAEIKILQ